jgi:hypothetical protein
MIEEDLVSDKDLERGYWWLTHKTLLNKAGFFIALLALLFLYIFLLAKVTHYFSLPTLDKFAEAANQSFDWQTYHQERKPQTLVLGRVDIIPVSGSLYNLAAVVKNPNPDWSVSSLVYRFVINGEAQAEQTTFVNPLQDKFLLSLGLNIQGPVKTADLQVIDIAWRRFENDLIDLDWQISPAKYQGPSVITVKEERVDIPARVTWQAQNLSLYNLWETNWQIALYNLDRLVGINQIQSNTWQSLESRDLEAVWLNSLPNITRVEVKADVDLLSSENIQANSLNSEENNLNNR